MTDAICLDSAPRSFLPRSDSPPSLFRDLKLKRKRVMDIVSNDCEQRAKSAGSSDCDTKSDSDSAYISDRSSEVSDTISIDDHPLKKRPLRKISDLQNFDQFTQQIKISARHQPIIPGNGGFGTGMTFIGLPPGYANVMQAHPMAFSPTADIMPNGMQLIPLMGPAPGILQGHMGGAPLLIAAPPTGFVCSSKGPPMVKKEMSSYEYPNSYGHTYIKTNTHSQRPNPVYKSSDKLMDNTDKAIRDQQFIAHYTNGKFNHMSHMTETSDRYHVGHRDDDSESDEIMMCAICNDRSTGLHYGIITCEGLVHVFFLPRLLFKEKYAID